MWYMIIGILYSLYAGYCTVTSEDIMPEGADEWFLLALFMIVTVFIWPFLAALDLFFWASNKLP